MKEEASEAKEEEEEDAEEEPIDMPPTEDENESWEREVP